MHPVCTKYEESKKKRKNIKRNLLSRKFLSLKYMQMAIISVTFGFIRLLEVESCDRSEKKRARNKKKGCTKFGWRLFVKNWFVSVWSLKTNNLESFAWANEFSKMGKMICFWPNELLRLRRGTTKTHILTVPKPGNSYILRSHAFEHSLRISSSIK